MAVLRESIGECPLGTSISLPKNMAFYDHYTSTQASRIGRTSITFFVKEGAKPMIRAALADGGYGTSYKEGLVNMLNELLESQNRQRVA